MAIIREWTTQLGLVTLVLVGGMTAASSHAATRDEQPSNATRQNPSLEQQAARLRATGGPAALDELIAQRTALIQRLQQLGQALPARVPDETLEAAAVRLEHETRLLAEREKLTQLEQLIDLVGGQRYCWQSQLYWHTDYQQALDEARESGKPVLCLRMLGKLTDEYSCANSRFFRTTLYANRTVADYLDDHFVLYWETVRPVPRVTIDFGDGRVVHRTLTGNSIHYVLDAEGRPVEALPGLYSPKAFLEGLQRAEAIERLSREAGSQRQRVLQDYHRNRLQAIRSAWARDLQALGITPAGQPEAFVRLEPNQALTRSVAELANRRAIPKSLVELPMLRGLDLAESSSREWLEAATDERLWQQIAELHREDARLSPGSQEVIRRENPGAIEAGRLSITKYRVEDPLLKLLRNLENSIALDTVRNEYQLHYQVHEWFVETVPTEMENLNQRVYAELFLTPDSDPWLGLVPPDTYTGLVNGGLERSGDAPAPPEGE